MNKKYYWIQLKKDWFDNKAIKRLRKIAGGDTYTIIYLKMLLKSLEYDGKLYFDGYCGSFEEELAMDLDEEVDNVKMTISYLLKSNLIVLHEDTIELLEEPQMVGSATTDEHKQLLNRERQKRFRERKKLANATDNVTVTRYSNTEKELYLEKELQLDKNIYSRDDSRQHIPFSEIIDYLNLKTNSNYKHSTRNTKDLIKARFNEGFTLEDFKRVIDVKTQDWLYDEEMAKYLRPKTLFGTKFESYLNQQVEPSYDVKVIEPVNHDVDDSNLEEILSRFE